MFKRRPFRSMVMLGVSWVLLSGGLAYGQSKKKDKDLGKSAVEEQLKEKAAKAAGVDERSEEEKLRAEEERKKEIEDLGGTPVSREEAVAPEVDPAVVDELLKEVESKNKQLVEKFQALLQKDPTNAKAPEWMFRIAEFKWEIASYKNLRDMREWSKEVESLDAADVPDEEWPSAPQPDYSEALGYYKDIVASHEDYERLDEVLFKLGDGLIRAGNGKEGVGYLHRLTQSYQDSSYLDRVYLAMGEYYFDARSMGTAQASYEKIVDNYPASKVFNYAQYKLAWTYVNTNDEESFVKAVEIFKNVVNHLDAQYGDYVDENGVIDENQLPVGEVSFRNQAINDMIVAYSEIDGGWKEAREFFGTKLSEEKLRKKMEKFAELMGEKGQFVDRVDIYRWLIERDPVHERIPEYAERIIDSHFNDNNKAVIESVTREFIEYFEPNGKWALVNKSNEKAYKLARVFAEDKLYSLAAHYLLEATAAIDRGEEEEAERLFKQARSDHEDFLARYPESQYAYDMNFYYAYILDENSDRRLSNIRDEYRKDAEKFRAAARERVLPDLKAAAQQYQNVIDMREKVSEGGEDHTRVSANRQVFVYANILASVDPDWSVEASGSTRNFRAEEKDSEIKEAQDLSEQEQDFVHSAEQYAGLFPTNEDTPGFLWRAAEVYRSKFHYNEAAQRFDDLVTNFPKHEYAGQAVGSMFALYNKAENWPKIEYWAEWLIDQGNFKVYAKSELEDAIGYSIGQQSEDLYEAKSYKEAAEKIYSIKARFPDREALVAPAVFSAANIYREGEYVAAAIKHYEEYRELFPSRVEAPLATFEAARLYAQKADFEDAAQRFELVPDEVLSYFAAKEAAPEPAKGKKSKKAKKKAKDEPEEAQTDSTEMEEQIRASMFVALKNAVQIREGMDQYEAAIADAKRYLELNPDGRGDVFDVEGKYILPAESPEVDLSAAKLVVNREGTVFHLAEILELGGKNAEALAQYQVYLDEYSDNKPVRVKAQLEIAKLLRDLKGRSWQRQSEKAFQAIEKTVVGMTSEEQQSVTVLLAEMYFEQAEQKFDAFKEVKLEFPVRTLKKRIAEATALRDEAEVLYKKVIDMKIARWSSAAAFKIGEMSYIFRNGFRELAEQVPPEIASDPDAVDEYVAWVEDELVYPFEDRAIAAFEFALTLAHELKVYNKWSQLSALRMTELSPDLFPVTSEKGVESEHEAWLMSRAEFSFDPQERGARPAPKVEETKEEAQPEEVKPETPQPKAAPNSEEPQEAGEEGGEQ